MYQITFWDRSYLHQYGSAKPATLVISSHTACFSLCWALDQADHISGFNVRDMNMPDMILTQRDMGWNFTNKKMWDKPPILGWDIDGNSYFIAERPGVEIRYSAEDECYIAAMPSLQGVKAHGDTMASALRELYVAHDLYLEHQG